MDLERKKFSRTVLNLSEWAPDYDNEAQNVAKELVESLFAGMASRSMRFYDKRLGICEMPYLYTERRLDSIMMPVLSNICYGLALDEVPVERRYTSKQKKSKVSQGRYDYWCIYKGYSFVIEVKHGFDAFYHSTTVRERTLDLWNTMIKQLKSTKKDVECYSEKTKGIIRLGLMFVTSYTDKEPTEPIVKRFRRKIPEISHTFLNELGTGVIIPRPDMITLWQIPDRVIFSEDRPYKGTFPGFWLLAKFFEPIKHKEAKR